MCKICMHADFVGDSRMTRHVAAYEGRCKDHVEAPLTRLRIRQVFFASNVDHIEADLVFVESRYEVLDLGHECWALG